MKKLYSIFAAAVFAATVNAQTTVDFVMADQGWANATVVSSGVIDTNLSFTAAKNSPTTAPTYYTADNSLRMYGIASGNGNSFTITPKNGSTITDVTITAVATYTPTVKYSVNGGTATAAALSGNTYTISGISASTSFTFQNAQTGTTPQLRITSISVTYTGGTLAVGDINSTKPNFVKNTLVDNSINFAAKADVKIVNMNGQVVRTASVSENAPLNVADLTKGTYIVTAIVNGKAVSEKIIKK